jgi:AcrR family transcriptional regulator
MALTEQAGSTGLRHRKKEATQHLLRAAALRLFSERGFANVSVDEIASAADVSRSTFFRYFGSKEAVLLEEIDEAGDEFLKLLNDRPVDETPWEAFAAAFIASASRAQGDDEKDRQQRVVDELLRTDTALHGRRLAMLEDWTGILAGVFARRRGREEPNFEDRLAASTCLAVSEEVGNVWRVNAGTPTSKVIEEAFAILHSF